MVRCVQCSKFTRETRHCSFYDKTISLTDIHKQISCRGYPNRAREKWLLNPHVQAEIFHQALGDKTK